MMAIKEITVAVCDWCGMMENAKVWGYQYNEPCYDYPDGWIKAPGNENMALCPACAERMKAKEWTK